MLGNRCLSFMMDATDNADIDTPEQWADAEKRKFAEIAAEKNAKHTEPRK